MSNHWLRLWHDMPNDPKWRTIARVSKQPLALVQAMYVHLLVDASRNVTRGHASVTNEDLASALDCDMSQVEAIRDAMEGRVLEGDTLTGWDARQPKREDAGNAASGAKSAAQRKREQRERQRKLAENQSSHEASRNVTTDKDKDKDTDIKPTHTPGGPASADPEPGATSPTGLETLGLEWQPDNGMLTAYAYRAGIPPGKFTPDAVGPFVVHHNAKGTLKTHAEHVAALVQWIKRDLVRDSRVVPLPGRRAAAGDFDDNATGWLGE